MGRNILVRVMRWLSLIVASGFALSAMADWELNMPRGVTEISQEIYWLHMVIFWVCVVIGVLVFGAMIYSLIKHRKSVHPEPATFHHSTAAEIAWTVIPIIILVVMAFPAAKVLVKIEDTGSPDLTVQVTGYQWNWHYEYPEQGIDFYSKLAAEDNRARQLGSGIDVTKIPNYLRNVDKPMVVPVNKKVRVLLTASDVIHAWWVPELSGKKDAVPGFVNSLWFSAQEEGTYRGQCAELCGRDHGFMPIVVEVVSEEKFNAWVVAQNGQTSENSSASVPTGMVVKTALAGTADASNSGVKKATIAASEVLAFNESPPAMATSDDAGEVSKESLMATGSDVYMKHCVACHQPEGQGMPPAFPAITGSAVATGPVSDHVSSVVDGRPGTAMLPFGPTLNDEEIAGVITFQRNALGNDVGDVVTPADIAAARSE